MNCNKCQKTIVKCFRCLKCEEKFCSSDCLIEHSLEHNNSMKQPNSNRRSSIKSQFIKFGQILKDFESDENFSIKNLDFISSKDKKVIIGTGEFANVYLAKSKLNNKYVAVKQILKNKINKDIVYREILIHRKFYHENIVKMYSHEEDDESFYIVTIKN